MLSEIIKTINKNEMRVWDYNLFNKIELCFPSYVKGINIIWNDEEDKKELYITINGLNIIKCNVVDGILIAEVC